MNKFYLQLVCVMVVWSCLQGCSRKQPSREAAPENPVPITQAEPLSLDEQADAVRRQLDKLSKGGDREEVRRLETQLRELEEKGAVPAVEEPSPIPALRVGSRTGWSHQEDGSWMRGGVVALDSNGDGQLDTLKSSLPEDADRWFIKKDQDGDGLIDLHRTRSGMQEIDGLEPIPVLD